MSTINSSCCTSLREDLGKDDHSVQPKNNPCIKWREKLREARQLYVELAVRGPNELVGPKANARLPAGSAQEKNHPHISAAITTHQSLDVAL